MWIEVVIPFDEHGWLASAYNRALEEGTSEWILFLDHDVFLCNPRWYQMCLRAIESVKDDKSAAVITCAAGGQRHHSVLKNGELSSSIEYFIEQSRKKYKEWGNTVQKIDVNFAGYFMLLNRDIAKSMQFKQVGKTINNIDTDFAKRLFAAGYGVYYMPGLYVYHRRGMGHLKESFVTDIQV